MAQRPRFLKAKKAERSLGIEQEVFRHWQGSQEGKLQTDRGDIL